MVAIVAILLVPIAIPMMPAVFAADIMTVNPTVMIGPMARHPNHFIFTTPVTRAMAVIRPVAYFDSEFLRRHCGRENDARGRYCGEQKFFRNHISDSDATCRVRPLGNQNSPKRQLSNDLGSPRLTGNINGFGLGGSPTTAGRSMSFRAGSGNADAT